MQGTFTLYNQESEEYEEFRAEDLFKMINEDRSEGWSEYNENSTIQELTEVVNELCYPYQF